MRPAVLALPRSGSAWLAAYLGYLHDPLCHLASHEIHPNSGIVDTGAAYNPLRVWQKYGQGPAVVLLRDPQAVYASCSKLHGSITYADVCRWFTDLTRFADTNGIKTFHYEQLFGSGTDCLEDICATLNCEFESQWAENFRHLHIEHPFEDYTHAMWVRYQRWVDA